MIKARNLIGGISWRVPPTDIQNHGSWYPQAKDGKFNHRYLSVSYFADRGEIAFVHSVYLPLPPKLMLCLKTEGDVRVDLFKQQTFFVLFIFSMKQKRKVAVKPATEDYLEEAVIMESYKPGTSHERETAWETVT